LQICDFEDAKKRLGLQTATETAASSRYGTVAYMPPEVFKKSSLSPTYKWDVYSFGILLWELLSEKIPFENGTVIVGFLDVRILIDCVCVGDTDTVFENLEISSRFSSLKTSAVKLKL